MIQNLAFETLDRKTFYVDINLDYDSIKKELSKLSGIPENEQFFIYFGNNLSNKEVFESYREKFPHASLIKVIRRRFN